MPPQPAPRSSAAPELRRNLLLLVVSILVLDAAVYGVRQALGVTSWPLGRQQVFTAVWVGLSLVVVSVFLQRIRAARVRARRARQR